MNAANEHDDEIELLLPWHAAGTLSRREAARVEAALASDPGLARRYELVREEFGATIALNETLGAPSSRAMQALFAKIDAEPARAPAASFNLHARLGEFIAGLSPRALAWSVAAAAFAVLLQAGVIAGVMIKGGGIPTPFETASVAAGGSGEGSFALIRFQPQASAADVAQFLEANKLTIAGGPVAGGLYRVRVAPNKLARDEVAAIVNKLQGNNKVVGFIAVTD